MSYAHAISRVALVTGASRGIGAAAAMALAAAGAHVILIARSSEGLREIHSRITASGGTATAYCFDIAEPRTAEALAAMVSSSWGRLDILIANAAVLGPMCELARVTDADGSTRLTST